MDEQLFVAARDGNAAMVPRLLGAGADPNGFQNTVRNPPARACPLPLRGTHHAPCCTAPAPNAEWPHRPDRGQPLRAHDDRGGAARIGGRCLRRGQCTPRPAFPAPTATAAADPAATRSLTRRMRTAATVAPYRTATVPSIAPANSSTLRSWRCWRRRSRVGDSPTTAEVQLGAPPRRRNALSSPRSNLPSKSFYTVCSQAIK